ASFLLRGPPDVRQGLRCACRPARARPAVFGRTTRSIATFERRHASGVDPGEPLGRMTHVTTRCMMVHVTEQGQHGEQPPGDPSPGSDSQHRPTAAQPQPAPQAQPATQAQPAPQAQPATQHEPEQQVQPPSQPDGIDPDTYRQFQQFQQFQEFQRFQQLQQYGGNEPVPQPSTGRRPRAPKWLRWLVRKLLSWLIFVLLTIIALYGA